MGTSTPTSRDLVPGFAAMVIAARTALQWSRHDLAEKSGLSYNTVYSIETEVRAPSLRVAAALSKSLGLKISLSELPETSEPTPAPKAKKKK